MAEYSTVYDLSCSWGLRTGSAPATLTITVTDEATGAAEVTGLMNSITPLNATIDLDACTVSIPNKQQVGEDADGPVYFYVKAIGDEGLEDGASAAEATVGSIDGSTITFPWDDAWAIGDFDNEGVGFYYLAYNNSLTIHVPEDPNKDPNEGWTSLGMGKYKASSLAAMYGASTDPVEVEVFEANEQPGIYKFVGLWPDMTDNGSMIVDATDPDFVIVPEQPTGFVDDADGMTYIVSVVARYLEKYDKETIAAALSDQVITMTDGVISFPEDAFNYRWPDAPADSPYGTDPESYYLGESNDGGYALLPGATVVEPDPNEGWTTLGMATFMDGWVLPCYGIDQTDSTNWYEVELQQNDDDQNVYRLVDPYHGDSPVASKNHTNSVGYIQFDVTNPERVRFATDVNSGFVNSQGQKIYCSNTFNWLSLYFDIYDLTEEDVLEELGEDYQFSTFKNGIVTIPSVLGEDGYINEACFGISADIEDNGYGWIDDNENSINMEAKIFFPGVDGIRELSPASEKQADVYYNLSGQRIAKPATPGLYIRNNSKVIVH